MPQKSAGLVLAHGVAELADFLLPQGGRAMEQEVDRILTIVKMQLIRKANMYDGFNSVGTSGLEPIGRFMFSIIEELGEVSSAFTRHRHQLAMAECIDVIHSALLLYKAIENYKEES